MLSKLEAASELTARRSIRRSLPAFCRLCGFEPARHHLLLLEKLERLATDQIDRLAVFMPPAPWYFAHHPDHCVIAASHTAELAEKWGRKVRNMIAEHQLLLGVELAEDSQAAGRWETSAVGSISPLVLAVLLQDVGPT
jgi:hypothetical protein